MVFTRKDGIFMGYVSFREGSSKFKNNGMLPYIKELKVIIQASYYHDHRQVPAKNS